MKCWSCGFEQPETFGELVKAWRAKRNLRDAGAACGVSSNTLSRIENGELPNIKTYVALVQAIGVSPEFAFELLRKQIGKAADNVDVNDLRDHEDAMRGDERP